MGLETDALRLRAKRFAVQVLRFVRLLPTDPAGSAVARQLARSGTSVSANYHSAGQARSRAEFISRLAIVVDEADETVHWLTVIRESELSTGAELDRLITESRELRAIFTAALRTARLRR